MKKTTMKMSLIALCLMALGFSGVAQTASVGAVTVNGFGRQEQDLSKLPKMEKDIVILQNVLSDLFSNKERSFYTSRAAKGMYVPGNGVIFSMGSSNMYGDILVEYVSAQELLERDVEEEEEVDIDELNKKTEEAIREKSKEFLTNYGSLLSELKSGEKLMLNIDYAIREKREERSTVSNRVRFVSPSRSIKKRMQSSISYKTLNDFSTGKINMQQAMAAVETKAVEDAEKDMTDAKILAGILDDLLQSSLDGKFKRRGKTSWTYFNGFGLMFNIQMGTQVSNGLVIYSQGGTDARVVNRSEKEEERKKTLKEVEDAYPEFENLLKENIIQYGRTLRSLGEGESVIVNVDLGGYYNDSELPRSIRMIVPKSSIDAYAKGQKSLEQVKQEIDITKLQSSIGGNSGYMYSTSPDGFFQSVYETTTETIAPAQVSGTVKKTNR
ncbi:MAG: hypothetical protein HWE07_13190 [Cytophagia bacterium]|nr:hypothetical protein [Cytophagia bacterium]